MDTSPTMRTAKWIGILAAVFALSIITSAMLASPIDGPGYLLQKSIQDIRAYTAAVNLFRTDHKRIPTDQEGLLILTDPDSSYIDEQRPDPWDTPYFYKVIDAPKGDFSIHSAGPNRLNENGLGDDVVVGAKNYKCSDFNMCRSFSDFLLMASSAVMLLSFLALVFLSITWLIQQRRSRINSSNLPT